MMDHFRQSSVIMSDSENLWERVPEDSPYRCQGISARGQCLNRQVEGSNFCMVHGGQNVAGRVKKERQRLYALDKYQQKLDKMEDHSELKTLRSEIGIMRMLLETRLNQCNTDTDLLIHSQSISLMVSNIEKLVSSCTKIDLQLGKMLDENQAINWVYEIVEIIGRHVKDSQVLDDIASEIIDSYEAVVKV